MSLLALAAACSGKSFSEGAPDEPSPIGGSGSTPSRGGSAPDIETPPEGGAGGETSPPDPPPLNCASQLHDTWQTPFGDVGNAWLGVFGDASVDTANGRLILSYDDVVQRQTALEGGYFVSFSVSLQGTTAFTPYVANANVTLPSLRRSGSDIELGGTKYGSDSVWSTSEPPGFGGAKIEGTTEAIVTVYVKAEAFELAVKVEAAGETYRSGWLTSFANADADLSGLLLVGENNSSGSGGSGDEIWVGALSGCTNLGDATVQAQYEL